MDNLRKRDYANFNNDRRNNRGYPPRRNSNMNNSNYNRNNYGNRGSRPNRDSDREVKVQYSNRSNSSNPLAHAYDSFSNTVQKKFNNVLYKGQKNKDDNLNRDKGMVSKLEDEQQATVPKSVFIFITIAVIFATCLVLLLAVPSDNSESKVADSSKKSDTSVTKEEEEDGFQTYAELSEEELQEQLDALEDNYLASETNNDNSTETATSSTDKKTNTTTKKNNNTTSTGSSNGTTPGTVSNSSSNSNQSSSTNKNNVTETNVARPTISPDSDDEEDDSELVEDSSNGGTFTIPCSVPSQGSLYRCAYSYASVGSDGRFVKYSNYVSEPYGTSVQKNDLNGMWLFSKGLALSESTVSNVIGYRNGVKVDVCKITVKTNGTTKKRYIYAMKGTIVPFTDGNYKINGTSSYIKSITVACDVTIIEY